MKHAVLFLSFFTVLGLYHLSAQSSIQWQRSFGGSDGEEAYSVIQTRDGGYAVTGYTSSVDGDIFGQHGSLDCWVLKLDSLGNKVWSKVYGGSGIDRFYAIKQTPDEGYIAAGISHSNNWDVSGNHGEGDFWVVKLNSDGVIQWQKALGGSARENAFDVNLTDDGGYIVVGFADSNDGDVVQTMPGRNYWIVKINNMGTIEWQKTYGGSGGETCKNVFQTNDGGYILAGESKSTDGDVSGGIGNTDFWVVKLNFEGKLLWETCLGGNGTDQGFGIVSGSDGGYVVVGHTSSTSGHVVGQHGATDYWVAKIDDVGILEWQHALGGSGYDYGYAITRAFDGGYVLTGQTESTNGDVVGNDGGADFWVVKINAMGELQWQKTMGGSMGDGGFSIQATSDGGYITAGLSWSNNGDVTENKGEADFWVVKLSPETSASTQIPTQNVALYPNPATESLYLSLPASAQEPIEISIFTPSGQEIRHFSAQSASAAVDVSGLPAGVYSLRARMRAGGVYVGRFTKQ